MIATLRWLLPAVLVFLFPRGLLLGEETMRPHIVVFLTDDHTMRDSTVYGATDVRTPHMSRLAAAGLTFERAFVVSPSCAPSRAALLTGLMPARNGAEANHSKPRADLKKLPAYMQELGYEVVAFGKVSHYRHTADYGFDHFANDAFHEHVAIPNALAWLRARKSDRPLCLFVGSNWPHVPWPEGGEGYEPKSVSLPPAFVDTRATRESRARYFAAVTRMDTELGQVFDAAREVLGKDLLFLTTSDHGAQWPFGKWTCYDDGIRTSLIAVWPERIAAGTRTDAMVSWVDLLPTLVEVAGGHPPESLDGRSFARVLTGAVRTHRDRIFTTHSGDGRFNVYPIRSLRTAEWKYIRNLNPEFYFTTHVDLVQPDNYFRSWKTAAASEPSAAAVVRRYHQRPAEELYDLRSDPNEMHNLAATPAHATRLAAMRADLDVWMKEQGDAGRVFQRPRLLTDPDRDEPPAPKKK